MNKANECTCPSGDGSLRWPCPAHPAVEQAGGDERAAFERAFTVQEGIYFDDKRGEYRSMNLRAIEATDAQDLNLRLQGWQARAALAQPSPVRSSLLINGYQLRAALDFIAPDGTAEQLESEACIEWRQQDADFLEAGLYAFCAEYPEEGGVLLDEEPTTAQPSPLQSEQAEAERPEVAEVAFVLRNIGAMDAEDIDGDNVDLRFEDAEGRDTGCDVSIVEYAEKAADLFEQHERIVGELRAVITQLLQHKNDYMDAGRETYRALQNEIREREAEIARLDGLVSVRTAERDAALARVAELERQEPVDVPGPDEIHQMAFEEGQPAEDGDGYLFSAEEFDLFVQRLLDSCATPVAWAQHSVPEGWMLVECGIWTQEQVDEMQKTVTRFRNSEFVDDRALAMAVADAGQCKAPEISLAELLAAAPVCRLSRSALTDAQMRRLYDSSTETENERLGFAAFARLIRRAEAVHQIAAAPGKEGV